MKKIPLTNEPHQFILVDDADYARVSKRLWRLHDNGVPRTRVFQAQLKYDPVLGLIVPDDNFLRNKITWIPIDRFIYRLTPHNYVRILHPPGGRRHKNGDQLECRKRFIRLVPKREDNSIKYIGIKPLGDKWAVFDDKIQSFVSDGISTEEDAARAYDRYIVTNEPFNAKTNFYYEIM